MDNQNKAAGTGIQAAGDYVNTLSDSTTIKLHGAEATTDYIGKGESENYRSRMIRGQV